MPLTCAEATTRLNALDLLNQEFRMLLDLAGPDAATPAEARAALEKAKKIKAKLEQGMVELSDELELQKITVSDAINPYAEALKAAGVPATHPECAETKEITVDFTEIVAFQADRYRSQNLPEWSEDIIKNLDTLFDLISTPEEGRKIEARIKAGCIPVVMPSRAVQLATWQKSFDNLKPEWIQNGTKPTLAKAYTYDKYSEKMTDPTVDPQNSFFRDIPDRPYFVWTKSTLTVEKTDPEWKTTGLNVDKQREKLAKLHQDHPDLVDAVDLLPTEYAALQSVATRAIEQRAIAAGHPLNALPPLDDWNHSYTRFLSVGLFSGGGVPRACFFPGNSRLGFGGGAVGASAERGFRPAARS